MVKELGLTVIAVTVSFLCATIDQANAASVATAVVAQCEAIASANLAANQDAPTQVTAAKFVGTSGGVPAYCEVQGYVAPQVGFRIGLPTSGWNGKFLELGCGEDCGDISGFVLRCSAALQKGYACIISDKGHTGGGGLWAGNNLQAQVDC